MYVHIKLKKTARVTDNSIRYTNHDRRVYGPFRSKTFRQQDTSAAEEYYRSVQIIKMSVRIIKV